MAQQSNITVNLQLVLTSKHWFTQEAPREAGLSIQVNIYTVISTVKHCATGMQITATHAAYFHIFHTDKLVKNG